MRSPVATRTTPTLKRCGCRYQKRESCRHDRFDEASRAIREKIEDKGSGRSSGKHAHVVTCTSPLQRTSEPEKIRRPPRTRPWVARPSTCDAHRQRCTTPAFMETTDRHLCTCRLLIGQPIHRRNGGRTPRVMDEASRKKPGRHAGRGTPATSLDCFGHGPVWTSRLLTRRERAPLRKCGGGCLRSATTQVHGAETLQGTVNVRRTDSSL